MQLGQITLTKEATTPVARRVNPALKAAIVVQFFMSEKANLPLDALPENLQAELPH